MNHPAFAGPLFAAALSIWAAAGGCALAGVTQQSALSVAQDSTSTSVDLAGPGVQQHNMCYYYRGRHYPYHWRGGYYHYRYHGRYCNHRYYRHGGWYC